ncbi:FAD-dependent oxidoreductase [Leucothrix sargassi]|nr:FAD-dependent oxidoreductase [Leucothrix sargassi]
MNIQPHNEKLSTSGQLTTDDLATLKEQGVEVLICNRPDGEEAGQPSFADIQAAAADVGIEAHHIPFAPGKHTAADVAKFAEVTADGKKAHAYCRTGGRIAGVLKALEENSAPSASTGGESFDVVIVGAGSAGISTAASLHKRSASTSIALIDPSEDHYYQPGWTMVGGGVFGAETTHKKTQEVMPSFATWIKDAVASFNPADNTVTLESGKVVAYKQLVVAPGLKLNWAGIEGLEETLGKNGVTSNYRYNLAPYTWELVQNLKQGKALFTQPPMPIKCAGAPQKALYLSASEWLSNDSLKDIDVSFYNAGGVLFGVADYVPALMEYMEKYSVDLQFNNTLFKVDGPAKTAYFNAKNEAGEDIVVESKFDMLHVCPPQCAPDFIRDSELADAAGWLDVHPDTLQHKTYANIWGAGDVMNTTNAKTMAAARKQAPVVAQNIADALAGKATNAAYDGYGSCPLTVEKGKIVLAEFTYGGKVNPTFPTWVNDGLQPSKLAWTLKANILPTVYWKAMLKGHEWFAGPK